MDPSSYVLRALRNASTVINPPSNGNNSRYHKRRKTLIQALEESVFRFKSIRGADTTQRNCYPKILDLKPYDGKTIQLMVAIDVGDTHSGVSYSILRPGEVPTVYAVTKFTDQTSGDQKIPSIMYYDSSLKVRAAGASAVTDSTTFDAEFEGWYKVEHFKLRLRPSNMRINGNILKIEDLPPSLTAVGVMGDFLGYLYRETLKFIESHHTDGEGIIRQTKSRATFILTHPNGWAGPLQRSLLEAAIHGGLIEDTISGRSRIKFVSDGKANVFACLACQLCPPNLEPGYRFMIVDAGGCTLVTSSYEVISSSPLRIKEITASDCRFAGSAFVNLAVEKTLEEKLSGTSCANPDIVADILSGEFESGIKRVFENEPSTYWVPIESHRKDTPTMCIRLDGSELATCFRFSVNESLASIRSQLSVCGVKAMPVWLVGGLGSSPWLLKKLKQELVAEGVVVGRPDIVGGTSKAVSNGAIYHALSQNDTAVNSNNGSSDPQSTKKESLYALFTQRMDDYSREKDQLVTTRIGIQVSDSKTRAPEYGLKSQAKRHKSSSLNANNQNLLPVRGLQTMNNKSENIREVKPSESLAQTGHTNLQFQTKPDGGTEKELIKDFESLRDISESVILTIADEWGRNRNQIRAGRMNSNIRSAIWPITEKWNGHLPIVLGRHFYDQLRNARSRLSFPDYQNVVSNALSTILSHKVFEIVSIEFAPGLSSESRQEFDSVFRDLLSTGPSHDALRWRAAAYTSLTQGTRRGRVEEFRKTHQDDLLDAFRTVLYVGGVRLKYLMVLEDIVSKSKIIEKAIQFGGKMKTQYFSFYPDVFAPKQYEVFEENTMEVLEKEQFRVRSNSPIESGSYEVGYTLFLGLLIHSPSNDIKDRILVKCQIARLELVRA